MLTRQSRGGERGLDQLIELTRRCSPRWEPTLLGLAEPVVEVVDDGLDRGTQIGSDRLGVGFATQLAAARGVTVLGTTGRTNDNYMASLGATPVRYGDGLVARVREISPGSTRCWMPPGSACRPIRSPCAAAPSAS
jgi:hypothetical protein